MILQILESLGVNKTVWLETILFLAGFIFLYYLVFQPYYTRLEKRRMRTEGNVDAADSMNLEITKLEEKLSVQKSSLNKEISLLYSEAQKVSQEKSNEILDESKSKANSIIEGAIKDSQNSLKKAEGNIGSIVQQLKQEIVNKTLN